MKLLVFVLGVRCACHVVIAPLTVKLTVKEIGVWGRSYGSCKLRQGSNSALGEATAVHKR